MTFVRNVLCTTLLFLSAGGAFAGPVNVNTADAETIAAELNGVGLAKALAIVEHRKTNGPFKSVDELLNVTGIGAKTLELNRALIRLEDQRRARKN